jgi:hypothetical protein
VREQIIKCETHPTAGHGDLVLPLVKIQRVEFVLENESALANAVTLVGARKRRLTSWNTQKLFIRDNFPS